MIENFPIPAAPSCHELILTPPPIPTWQLLPIWSIMILSPLFWYIDKVTFRPHQLAVDPANRTIVDNVGISQQDFAYLVTCCRNVLIYGSGQHIYVKVYYPGHFHRLQYNHHLSGIVDSSHWSKWAWQRCSPAQVHLLPDHCHFGGPCTILGKECEL